MKNYLNSLIKATVAFFSLLAFISVTESCKKTEAVPPVVIVPDKPVITVGKGYIPEGWKALESFTEKRLAATAVVVNEKIYVGLGYNAASGYTSVTNDWYEYTPSTGKWAQKAPFPGVGRANAIGFSLNGKAYVGMGTNYDRVSKGNVYVDFYEYDPATDVWTKKGDFKGQGRDQSIYFTIGTKGYMGTGNPDPFSPAVVDDFWEYDPATDKWTTKAVLAGGSRCRAFCFSVNDKGYVGGGEDRNVAKLSDFWEYSPATNIWMMKQTVPVPISRSRGFSFGDFGYVTGGVATANSTAVNTVYKYTPSTNIWGKISDVAVEDSIVTGRFYQIAVTTKTKAYIGMGASGIGTSPTNQKDFYEYTPK